MDKTKKCGIVTFHSAHNYGSVLQAYALAKTLKTMGLYVEIIDYRHPHTTDKYIWKPWSPYKTNKENIKEFILRGFLKFGRKREIVFSAFIEEFLPTSKRLYDKKEVAKDYDILVCGSDQIWNPLATGENAPFYYLDFAKAKIKFSYAASSGSQRFAEKNRETIKRLLSEMKAISVREEFMKEYIEKELHLSATVTPDPTFLLSSEEWTEIESPYSRVPSKYLLVYAIQKSSDTVRLAKNIAKQLNLPVVQICNERGVKAIFHNNVDYCLMDVSPNQFLWLFHNASFVVTNTFHGNMFSIIFRKNFIHYNTNQLDTRIQSLHSIIGLGTTRILNDINDFNINNMVIDYHYYEDKIKQHAEFGRNFIRNTIEITK